METRANYIAIGLFVVTVLIGALAALWWLYKASDGGATEPVRIVFPEPVTGLSVGGSVLFNGIRVGEVTNLEFEQKGGDDVIAFIRVSQKAPIKTDTTAKLGFTGLTGVAYISLTGGSQTAESLFTPTVGDIPTIYAETSAFTNVLDSAQGVLARVQTTLDEVNGFLADNRSRIDTVVDNVTQLTSTLNEAAPQVSGFVSDVASAGRGVAAAVPRITDVVDRADTLLGAVDPARVSSIVQNVDTFSGSLAPLGEEAQGLIGNINGLVTRLEDTAGTLGDAVQAVNGIVTAIDGDAVGALLDNVRIASEAIASQAGALATTIESAATISEGLAGRMPEVETIIADFGATASSARTFAADLPALAQSVRPGIENAGAILSAIDPAAVSGLVDGASSFVDGLAAQREPIARLIENAGSAAQQVETLAAALGESAPQIRATVTRAEEVMTSVEAFAQQLPALADTVRPGLENASAVLSAIDPAAVSGLVDGASSFVDGLAAQREPIARLIENAGSAAQQVETLAAALGESAPQIRATISRAEAAMASVEAFTDQLPALADTVRPGLENASAVLSAIEPSAVTELVDNAASFAQGLAAQREPIAGLIANASTAAEQVGTLASALGESAPQIRNVIDRADSTMADVQQFAQQLPELASALQPGVENASEVLSAVDPQAVRGIVESANSLAATLAAQDERIGSIMTAADATARRVEAITSALAIRVPQIGDTIDEAEAAVRSARTFAADLPGLVETLQPGIANVSDVMAAIDPSAIEGIVTSAANLADGLSAQREPLEQLIGRANATAANAERLTGALAERTPQIEAILQNVEVTSARAATAAEEIGAAVSAATPAVRQLAAAIEVVTPERVDDLVTQAQIIMAGLGRQAPNVEAIIEDARATAEAARTISVEIAQRVPQITGIVEDASTAAGNVREASDALPGLVASVEPGIQNVGTVLSALDAEAIAKVQADVVAFSDMLAGQRQSIEALLSSASGAAVRIEAVAAAIAQRMPQIGEIMNSAESAVASASDFAGRLPALADTLQPGIENVAQVLSAVDPAAVSGLVDNASQFAQTLSEESEAIRSILSEANEAVRGANEVIQTVAVRSPAIAEVLDAARDSAASVRLFADRLPQLAETLEPGIDNIANALSAIDSAAINAIVENARTLSQTLADQSPAIAQIVTSAQSASENVARITTRLDAEIDGVSRAMVDVQAALGDARTFAAGLPALLEEVRPGIQGASAALSAIEPEAITEIVTNVRSLSQTLADARGDIDTILSTAGAAAREVENVTRAISERIDEISGIIDNVSSFAGSLGESAPDLQGLVSSAQSTLASVSEAVNAVNADAINAVVADVRRVANVVGERAGEIGTAIDNAVGAAKGLAEGFGTLGGEDGALKDVIDRAKRIAANLESASAEVGLVVDRAGNILDGPAQRLITNVATAAEDVSEVAGAFASRAGTIAGGLSRFSQGGLDDLRALLNQGRSTLAAIESAVSSFDRDPSRVIFGGSDGPRYTPQRR